MAITIIGEKKPPERPSSSRPEADLPRPGSAPAAERTLRREQIASLFDHENPLVRAFAVEQTRARTDEDWTDALIAKVNDPHPAVAMEAMMRLDERRAVRGAEAIAARFATSNGEVAAVAAKALGRLAPARLLSEVKKRGRLDDEAYAATATALAVVASPDVVEFLDQAMNRAGALHAERRVALYGAALLSGHTKLTTRALTLAIRDSKEEEPENASFPTRAALAAISGLPMVASRRESGLELYDHMRDVLEKDAERVLPDVHHREALLEALKIKRPNFILECLIPVLKIELATPTADMVAAPGTGTDAGTSTSNSVSVSANTNPSLPLDGPESLGSLPRRRHGLLAALIEQRNAIGALDLPAAALFLVVATQAVQVILAGAKRPADDKASAPDAALVALSKALEGHPSAEALEAMSLEATTEFFKAKSPRDMRRLLGVMSRETWTRPETRRRILEAVTVSGHAGMLFQAASETDETPFHQTVFDVAQSHPSETEDAVVEALDETPIERRKALFLLALIDRIRTTRVALAVGRAAPKLNEHDRNATTRALLRLGDDRLLPLLEARAFRDEPEEAAFLILSLIHKKEVTGRLKQILERAPEETFGDKPHLRLGLKCKHCGEIFTYRIEHVHLDIEAKDEFGDPVFVGEIRCKACQTQDALEPTPESGRIIANHMLSFLSAARAGQLTTPPLVTPSQTSVLGRRLGFAAALRALNEAIERSPDGIRPRIQRARVRMILERPGVEEDADAALAIDPNAVEGKALKAAARARAQDFETAMRLLSEAWHLVQKDAPGRIYETDDRETFASGLEDNMLSLAHHTAAPTDIDLGAARARFAEREAEEEAHLAAQAEAEEAEAQAHAQGARSAANDQETDARDALDAPRRGPRNASVASAAKGDNFDRFRHVGRNDACPCGSGKKFKKCHGATATR
ncbi:MAG: SEC-C domain-containing protein [Deltaproteobacteria bacterium]|nr:SEC-C domain-containing protein [Deltaproteobacteria bacterium]